MSISKEIFADLKNLDPVQRARLTRDRNIALSFVRMGQTKTARAHIAKKTGVNLRTVYRAIEKELDWALDWGGKGHALTSGPTHSATESASTDLTGGKE